MSEHSADAGGAMSLSKGHTVEKDTPDVAALREALTAIREEYEDEDVPAVKAGLSIAYDAVRVVLNAHTRAAADTSLPPGGGR